jgi:hypothetical protein
MGNHNHFILDMHMLFVFYADNRKCYSCDELFYLGYAYRPLTLFSFVFFLF